MSIILLFLFQRKCDKIASIGKNIYTAIHVLYPLESAMEFYQNLYIGDSIKKPDRIKKKLKKYDKINNVWLISYAKENRQLEIYHSLMLQQYYYKENPPYIIGIAGSQEEAAQIIRRIAEECVRETGNADLTAYLFADRLSGDDDR